MEYDALKGLRHSETLVVEHKDTAAVYATPPWALQSTSSI